MTGQDREGRRQIRRNRRRRVLTGFNVLVSVLLAFTLMGMINELARRYPWRWDMSRTRYYALSDKTLGLLSGLTTDVDIIVFFQRRHELFDDVRNLLKEYEYAARKTEPMRLKIRFVDPDRDLALTKELKQKYDLSTANVVVFSSGGRKKYVEAKDVVDYDYLMTGERSVRKKKAAFNGEQAFSSAILAVAQAKRPVVYFLAGHGECDVQDYGRQSGYSSLARVLTRDNLDVRPLLLAEHRGVPDDCSALVIAGPDRKLSSAELDMISSYVARNGRLFLLADPAVSTGMEALLKEWNVGIGADVVVGLTLTGRELVVNQYGDHPITRRLKRATTLFYMPCSVEPLSTGSGVASNTPAVDRPRVSVLAANTKEGWAETDLDENPPRFDEGKDRRGPVAVAVAVEKGPVEGIDVELKATRMVIVGDSFFVSNGALSSGAGGNLDFFMSAINWLVERETLMAIAPRTPGELRLDMDRGRMRIALGALAAAAPTVAALAGLLVWLRRRR